MPTRDDMNGAVIRAARELRNASQNLVRDDVETSEAWRRPDRALTDRDDG